MPDIEKASDPLHRGQFYESDTSPTGSLVGDRAEKDEGYTGDSVAAQLARLTSEEYAAMETKLVAKIDWHLIPWMTLLYLMSFLDRVNVGAAKLVGLTKELHLSSQQYSNASTIFFVTYVVFEVPSNLVLKKFRPSRWIPATMVLWAICQTLMGLVTNYHQLLALRLVLGVFEAGLFPGLNFLLTGWYRREELNKRTAVFFAGAVLAGAFGGIFGFALSKMDGVGGKQGWSWIFIWEGVLTFIIAIASFWMIHDWPEQSRFLTPLEKEMVLHRMKQEQGLATEGKFSWRIIRKSLKDWKIYILMLMYLSAAVPLYSGSLFSPTIIASLGHWTTPQSLLLSTPPYVVCFITTLGTAYLSDKYKQRGPFLMFWSVILCAGYAILLAVPIHRSGVLYFAVFVTTMSAGPLIATTISWTANTWGHHYKRAVGMGLVFSAGNSGGIVSSQIYRNRDAPRFIPGHATALGFGAMCGLSALFFYIALKRENGKRDQRYGKPPGRDQVHDFESDEWKHKWGLEGMSRDQIVELGDNHPAFRYVL